MIDRKLLQRYDTFRSDRSGFNANYQALVAELPFELQKILVGDEFLKPRHCSSELIKELYLEALTRLEPKFQSDENCEPVIDIICKRVSKSNEFEGLSPSYGLKKGIMLLGSVGSGKTLLMRGLIQVLKRFSYYSNNNFLKVAEVPTYKLTEMFSRRGFDFLGEPLSFDNSYNVFLGRDSLFIDDLGAETIASHYGQITNVVAELILRRYDAGALTLGTSNLDQKNLHNFYGERAWSRMKEMFNFIVLPGNDRRK